MCVLIHIFIYINIHTHIYIVCFNSNLKRFLIFLETSSCVDYNSVRSLRNSGAFPAWFVYQVLCYRSSDFTRSEFVIQLLLWAVLEDKEPIHSDQESWNLSSKSRIWSDSDFHLKRGEMLGDPLWLSCGVSYISLLQSCCGLSVVSPLEFHCGSSNSSNRQSNGWKEFSIASIHRNIHWINIW